MFIWRKKGDSVGRYEKALHVLFGAISKLLSSAFLVWRHLWKKKKREAIYLPCCGYSVVGSLGTLLCALSHLPMRDKPNYLSCLSFRKYGIQECSKLPLIDQFSYILFITPLHWSNDTGQGKYFSPWTDCILVKYQGQCNLDNYLVVISRYHFTCEYVHTMISVCVGM